MVKIRVIKYSEVANDLLRRCWIDDEEPSVGVLKEFTKYVTWEESQPSPVFAQLTRYCMVHVQCELLKETEDK